VIVRLLSEHAAPDDPYFDEVVRAAAGFLADFIPGSCVVLTYYDTSSVQAVMTSQLEGEPSLVASYGRAFSWRPFDPKTATHWIRDVGVHLPPELWAFISHPGPDDDPDKSRPILPKELDAVLFLAVDIADQVGWLLEQSPLGTDEELRRAALESLPDRLVSLAAAVACFGRTEYSDRALKDVFTTVQTVLRELRRLSTARVEGEPQSQGVVIRARGKSDTDRASYPSAVSSLKRTAALSNGSSAVLVLDRRGGVERIAVSPRPSYDQSPEEVAGVATAVGISLRRDSSIVITIRGVPFATLRNGRWRALLGTQLHRALEAELGKPLGSALGLLAYFHQQSGHGALIAVTDDLDDIKDVDRVAAATSPASINDPPQWVLHRALPKLGVAKLPVPFLSSIVAIDGATLVSPQGELLAYGAIIPSENAGLEGARTSAARALSSRGLTLKISEDGPISVWRGGRMIIEI
jgi:hypothetical protein